MSLQPLPRFRCPPLADLTRQLLFAPPPKRIAQVRRTEALHDQIDPATDYPLDFIQFRITRYRSEKKETTVLAGADILPDLRQLIDALSHSVAMPLEPDESVASPRELAQRLHVSTKTIQRWRDVGLRWRWVVRSPGGRKQIGFADEAVAHFLARHDDRARRAAGFSQIDPQTRQALVERARRIARRRQVTPFQIAAHLAKKTGRALETIRQLLEHHDREHPEDMVFVDRTGPLSDRDKRTIARAVRAGAPASQLARSYGCTRTTIYRAGRQRSARALRRLRLSCVTSPTFTRDDADEVILGREWSAPQAKPTARKAPALATDDLPQELRPLYHQPTLAAEPMRRLFVSYNYLKYKADRTIRALDPNDPKAADLEDVRRWVRQARSLRAQLAVANLPVVLSVARRHLLDHEDGSTTRLLRLLDLGHEVLLEHINSYDPGRPQPFAAYLTWRYQRAFAQQESQDAASSRAQRRLTADEVLRRLRPLIGNISAGDGDILATD